MMIICPRCKQKNHLNRGVCIGCGEYIINDEN